MNKFEEAGLNYNPNQRTPMTTEYNELMPDQIRAFLYDCSRGHLFPKEWELKSKYDLDFDMVKVRLWKMVEPEDGADPLDKAVLVTRKYAVPEVKDFEALRAWFVKTLAEFELRQDNEEDETYQKGYIKGQTPE